MQLKSKIVWITGAANGIGKRLSTLCYEQGAIVVQSDINLAALENNNADREKTRIMLHVHNVAAPEQWQQIFEHIKSKFGQVDILMNVAGVIEPGFIHETTLQKIDRQIDINLKGTIYGVHTVAPDMVKAGSGHIINFGSLASLAPVPGLNIYSASKYGVRGFSLAIAQELEDYGVNVSVICPDAVNTDMLDYQKDKKEAALTFSGDNVLSVEDIAKAIDEMIKNPKKELWLPTSRGITAMASSLFPGLAKNLRKTLTEKGLKNQKKY